MPVSFIHSFIEPIIIEVLLKLGTVPKLGLL